jgi:hypothetical protein
VAIDTSGTVTFANEATKRMFLYETEGLEGHSIDEFVATESRGEVWRIIHNVTGIVAETEPKPDGSDSSSLSDPYVVSSRSSERVNSSSKKWLSSEGSNENKDFPPAKQTKHDGGTDLEENPQPSLPSKDASATGASSLPGSTDQGKSPTTSDSGYKKSSDSQEELNERSSSTMSDEDMTSDQTERKCYFHSLFPLTLVSMSD